MFQATPVTCEVCSLTVSCQKTYESHINGKPHRKRAAQTEKIRQLQEKVKQDTERAMNSVPGGDRPNNPLQSRPNGDIYCTVCDVNMNSGAQAQGHIMGVKHKSRMDRAMRSLRGRGGRGVRGGRGFGRGFRGGYTGGQQWAPPPGLINTEEADCDDDEAQEEYDRVLSEALADNVDMEEAEMRAEAAKQAALGAFASLNNTGPEPEDDMDEMEYENEFEDNGTFPPPGIDVIKMPEGDDEGQYRCLVCGVMLLNNNNLTNHLQQLSHQMSVEDKRKERRQEIERRRANGRGRGKIYRGRCNAYQEGSMKAQRGRRGLISYGEVMPNKLTKGQKKAQPKDIAELLAKKGQEAGINSGGAPGGTESNKKMASYLMSFVKGGVMEGNLKEGE